MRSQSKLFVVLFSAVILTTSVYAQNNRSAVSINGLDTNTCTVPDPCRTFGTAITKTNAGGEIIALTSGGYGAFTIGKAVSIISPAGLHVAIAPTAGTAITVAAASTDVVVLRGLYLNSLGASTGVSATSVGTLHVEDSVVNGFAGDGINFSTAGFLIVSDVTVRHNTSTGIVVKGVDATNKALATIEHCRLVRNGNSSGIGSDGGLGAEDFSDVTVRDSVAAGNFRGFQAIITTGTPTIHLAIENSAASMNTVGVFAGTNVFQGNASTVTVRVSGSIITHNTLFGIEAQASSQILSRVNNTVADNAAAETFTGTFVAQ